MTSCCVQQLRATVGVLAAAVNGHSTAGALGTGAAGDGWRGQRYGVY